MILMVKRASN